jgi:site-specific recombinase XerD
MGHSYRRVGANGKPRYAAIYHDSRGVRRSAGTFATRRDADRTWQTAEAQAALGQARDRHRGRIDFAAYVSGVWLPNHELEHTTHQRYSYQIAKYLIPEFGAMRMGDIAPVHVREWVTRLTAHGVSASTIADLKTILSAIFTTALNDQIANVHPCRGVKTPTVARKPRTIVTPEQFDLIHQALPDAQSRLLVELDVESGLRWGELTELRVADLNTSTRMLTVARAVVEINARFREGDQPRFVVKEYPKDKEYRRVKLSAEIVTALSEHIRAGNLGRHDLLFSMPTHERAPVEDAALPDPDELGRTDPNAAGRIYQHGTLTGYSLGSCRCEHCRNVYARYRAERRAAGTDRPRSGRTINTDGHLPRRWFAQHIWRPAVTAADLDFNVRVHDLRHAHASWLLAGGADVQVVKERLGHGSLRTTEKYLHILPDADETALDALRRTRTRTTR